MSKPDFKARLEALRSDYFAQTGTAFRYFFCPFLWTDEHTPLCRGHVINKAFSSTNRAWTIQRQDLDNFFG